MKKIAMLALVAVLSVVLTACGGGGGAAKKLEVVMGENGEMVYTPATLEVKKGEKVEVTIINKDSAQNHSFLIKDFNVKSKQVQPGQKETLTFTASKAGDIEFFCDVPGHKDGGMVGVLKVTQ